MDPQRRLAALWICRLRALLGVNLVLFPRLSTTLGLGTPTPVGTAAMRMVGVRDLAIGLGGVAGVREGAQAPEWMGWGALADGMDALALLLTPGLAKRARLVGLLAGASAAVGLRLAHELADERTAREVAARRDARLGAPTAPSAPGASAGTKVPTPAEPE